jgi:hypothetical protein
MLISRRRFEAAKRHHEAQKRLRIFRPESASLGNSEAETFQPADDEPRILPFRRPEPPKLRIA